MKYMLVPALVLALPPLYAQKYVAGYEEAKEEILREIPSAFIDSACLNLVVAYQHTSHGTHVSRGLYGLPDYKAGDDTLFAISFTPDSGKLEFRDYALQDYAAPGTNAVDLSANETAFIQATRNYLDAAENADVNVVMWAWCNISGHDVSNNYLPGMDSLVREYGPGGTKIGSGEGQRLLPVTFIYMTAHANRDANVGEGRPRDQALLITEHCDTMQRYCLDYYSIDTHDMADNYWEDAGDDGDSDAYGGNFYHDFQDTATLGVHYFENKDTPGGNVAYGIHTTQHITSNRKAFAMWYLLARIAGWDGAFALRDIELSSGRDSASFRSGDSLQIRTAFLPDFATDTALEWTVLKDTGSATISQEGMVSGLLPGRITVVARASADDEVNDSLYLWVLPPEVPVEEIQIQPAGGSPGIEEKDSIRFSALVLPDTASNPLVNWEVKGQKYHASISDSGLFIADRPDTLWILASALDGSGIMDSLQFIVREAYCPVDSLQITAAVDPPEVSAGEFLSFHLEVYPDTATNTGVIWSVIEITGEADISDAGILSALDSGEVIVVATALDNPEIADSLQVQINPPFVFVSSIEILSPGEVTEILSGTSLQMMAEVSPEDADDPTLDWRIEAGTGSAEITPGGLLTGLDPGLIWVHAEALDGSGVSDSLQMEVLSTYTAVDSIQILTPVEIPQLHVGDSLVIAAEVYPESATNPLLSWSVIEVSGKAQISEGGVLYALEEGSVIVVATSVDRTEITDRIEVEIMAVQIPVSEINIQAEGDLKELDEGSTLQFYVQVSPSNASDPGVAWSVFPGTGTAKISSQGLLTAGQSGTVQVKATAVDGSGVSDEYELNIVDLGTSAPVWESAAFRLWPNPTSGVFFLHMKEIQAFHVAIADIRGRMVLELTPQPGLHTLRFDLRGYSPGLYILKIVGEENVHTYTLILSPSL